MTHEMKLNKAPFEQIRDGKKTIELRLNDEKRQQVKVGDRIVFRSLARPEETVLTEVIALHRFPSFARLYDALPLLACGYTEDQLPDAKPEDMDAYYSPEKQAQYGVLGIELKVI